MYKIKFIFIFFSLFSAFSLDAVQLPSDSLSLYAHFVNPPNDAKPGTYWCWLNGDVTKKSITADLEAMHNSDNRWGVGNAFLSDSSVALIQHALREGKRLNMQIGMIASSGWNAGGAWVAPEWASKALFFSDTVVVGNNCLQELVLSFPDETGTTFNIQLPPYGSCFVVFGEEENDISNYRTPTLKKRIAIDTPWKLYFPKNWGAPDSIQVKKLHSWTAFQEEGIRYFSGTATYKNTFFLSADDMKTDACTIDLGEVRDFAEVIVNGKFADVLWTVPYRTNIKKQIKNGINTLEIKVTNMWVNRLTGDMSLPPEKRFCNTNHPYITENYTPEGDEIYELQPARLLDTVFVELR